MRRGSRANSAEGSKHVRNLMLTSSHDAGQPQWTPFVGGDGIRGDGLAGVQGHADHRRGFYHRHLCREEAEREALKWKIV